MAANQITFDRAAEKDRQEYRDALAAAPLPPEKTAASPSLQPMIATPDDLKLPSPLVTVSVNETVSLRDLMFELADQAGVDVEMDPQIRGSIIFTAKERPFSEVVERICEMSGLRYTFKDNVLRVELDRPYVKNYRVDYINFARKSSSSINSSISVASDAKSGASASGSSAKVDNTFDSDFWKEIDTGLKQVLVASDTYVSLATMADPVATPVMPPMPPMPPVDPNNPTAAASNPPPLPTVPPSLNVSMPSEPLLPSPPSTYSISKQTGVVSVFASQRQQKMVQRFLSSFRRVAMTQILIDAKVLEVSLSDEFASGIDWNSIHLSNFGSMTAKLANPGFAAPSSNVFTLSTRFSNGGAKQLISALSRFGTVRALSSPRVTVMNNQPAVVNVSENTIYFDIQTTQTPSSIVGGAPTITSTETIKSAPVGVLMNVLPTADADTGEVILAVRPTVSKITQEVQDPLNVGNKIPQMSVQEIDSVVKMQSGQTLVMGGLMKDDNTVTEEGLPVLGDVPMLGALFRNHSDSIKKTELVVLLHATIVPGGNNADDTDRKIYKEFSQDRHPENL